MPKIGTKPDFSIPPSVKKGLALEDKKLIDRTWAKAKADPPRKESLWKGPSDAGPLGGISFSMLSRFLACRERFRLSYVEGLKKEDVFSHHLEYGNFFHTMMESWAEHESHDKAQAALKKYAIELAKKYKESGSQINHWFNTAAVQFPIYERYWAKNEDVKNRKPISQEEVFRIPYKLPSGRVVYLRGKFDSVDAIKNKIWLMENKTKGEPDLAKIESDLVRDLQTMMYLTALTHKYPTQIIGGVRYNIIRRPLSGGKHSIKQREGRKLKDGSIKGAESAEQFYKRVGEVIAANPKHFFIRFKMEVTRDDLLKFQQRCLNPILMELASWWDSIEANPFDPWNVYRKSDKFLCGPNDKHWYYPSGVYNASLEGRGTEYDEYINTGNTRGLVRSTTLFRELQSA